mmetsp:Transcript_13820/g.31361  ORF Transcript_13820/g.31361 Transcript_13820/m.31361 type:complete len:219 (-) Transcript_13820:73-729(-)|eukprot:CAMPEP_0197888308 /NCGR_PEP_ID=MMETSP1439-20131203/21920_1 /TAXON_ID=66791 /ORGANISM="Gonyaulax spinifera, Strain CCMP409" /LENGTH=218 /DNA_ID=CAMNT_0043508215 /DNA_START=62 /DNA_END=718 /DNA_ORIENTATION=+
MAAMSNMSSQCSLRVEPRRRRGGMVLVGACLCMAACLVRPQAAWVPAAVPTGVVSRRSAAAGLATAMFGAVAGGNPQQANAQAVSEPGVNEELRIGEFEDPPEVIAKRTEARKAGAARKAAVKEEFRGYFGKFAADDATMEDRLANIKNMQNLIIQEKMIPLGITRKDIFKGTRTVKVNLGCVQSKTKQGECRTLDKAINKLFATMDKVTDLTVVVAR